MHKHLCQKQKILFFSFFLRVKMLLDAAVAKGGPCQGEALRLRVLSGVACTLSGTQHVYNVDAVVRFNLYIRAC